MAFISKLRERAAQAQRYVPDVQPTRAGREENIKSKCPWLLAVFLMVCFLGLNIRGQKQASARTDWEYKSVFSNSASREYVLNDLGAQGWELVAIDVTASDKNGFKGAKYYLKREK